MFTINVETQFRASHQLTFSDAPKEPPHNHDWLVTVSVSSNKLNGNGLVMDFRQLKCMVDNIVAELANTSLEQLDYFRQINPSAENVAKYIYEKLTIKLPKSVKLHYIKVVEEPGCSANFSK